MSESGTPRVSVVIPTRGKVALLRQAIKSLLASHDPADLDVVVVEHGGDVCMKMLQKEFPTVRHIAGEDDWSYSKMNNVGAATTSTPYLLLLNNDTISQSGFLDEMLKAMDHHPDVGIVGAKLLHIDGKIQHIGVVFKSDGLPYHLGHGRLDDGSFESANRDDYYDAVTFACALIRRQVWDAVGGLDEAYHFNYEDVDFCLKARELGFKSFVTHRAVVKHLESKSLDSRRTEKHSIWRNLRILRDRWIRTGKLGAMIGSKIDTHSGTMADEKLNIAFLPSGKGVGVPWWRLELPARKLAKLKLANVRMLYGDMDDSTIMQTMENANVAVFQGFTSEWVKRLAELGSNRGFGMVYDYDDHPIHIPWTAQAYKHFGCQEIKLRAQDGSEMWIWRDGQDGFNIPRNIENRERQLEIFTLVDLVTTTTQPLHTYFRESLNPNVGLLPNCIDFDVYRHQYTLFDRAPGPVRIGWHGGDNHFHDISTVGRALTEYVNGHDVQLVLFGAYYRSAFKGIDPSKVIEEEWVQVEAFPYKLSGLGLDVAVVPLEDPNKPLMKFVHFKSGIKFLENSAIRIPSLVQEGRAAYSCCTDGDNALTYNGDEEFTEKLDMLCKDADLRRRIGTRALEYTREYFDLEKNIHRWLAAYENVARSRQYDDEPDREATSNVVSEGAVA